MDAAILGVVCTFTVLILGFMFATNGGLRGLKGQFESYRDTSIRDRDADKRERQTEREADRRER